MSKPGNQKERRSRLRIRPAGGSNKDHPAEFEADSMKALEICRSMAIRLNEACVIETWISRGPGQWQLISGFDGNGRPVKFRVKQRPFGDRQR